MAGYLNPRKNKSLYKKNKLEGKLNHFPHHSSRFSDFYLVLALSRCGRDAVGEMLLGFFCFFCLCFPVSGGGSGVLIDELRETTKGGGGVTPVC